MTPKRRAALHKAQLASARKRRKSRNRKIAAGAGIIGTIAVAGVVGYAGRSYLTTTLRGRPKIPTPQLALPPGKGTVTKIKGRRLRPVPKRHGAFRVDSSGVASYVRRPRGKYDAKRRAGLVAGYEKKVRSKYAAKTFDGSGMSERTQRRRSPGKKARETKRKNG